MIQTYTIYVVRTFWKWTSINANCTHEIIVICDCVVFLVMLFKLSCVYFLFYYQTVNNILVNEILY